MLETSGVRNGVNPISSSYEDIIAAAFAMRCSSQRCECACVEIDTQIVILEIIICRSSDCQRAANMETF